MKRLLTLAVTAIAFVGIACGGGDSGQTDKAEMAKKAEPAAQQMSADHEDRDHEATSGEAEMAQPETGKEISLTGNMGCGHCNFQIGSSCAAAMKTADGHIVIFDDVPQESEMFQNRMDGAEVTVAGVISYDDTGVAHMKLKDTPM